jgi:hypothetical protein
MSHDEVDRILSREEEIFPTSRFADSVMKAVRREAAAPRPIPFPWKRALPGMITVAATLIYALVEIALQLRAGVAAPRLPAAWTSLLTPMVNAAVSAEAGWVALAALLTLASVTLSTHLTSRKI